MYRLSKGDDLGFRGNYYGDLHQIKSWNLKNTLDVQGSTYIRIEEYKYTITPYKKLHRYNMDSRCYTNALKEQKDTISSSGF